MSIRADVQHYFEKHSNEKIYLKDLAEHLEQEERPVQSAIAHLMRDGYELEVVARGQCWIYKPNTKAGNDPTFKVLGEGTNKTVLMDSNGSIWIAKKVDD